MTKKRKKELKEIAFAIFQAEQALQNNLTTEEDTLNNIEKIANELSLEEILFVDNYIIENFLDTEKILLYNIYMIKIVKNYRLYKLKKFLNYKGENIIMAMKENSRKVFEYVKEHDGENMTAADIAEGTGLEIKSVNGIVTSAFQKKGLMVRTPAEIQLEDGTHKTVKFISLTAEGKAFDPDATPAE